MSVSWPLAVLGALLLFALPGFALSRALFPEWRFRGEAGTLHAVETVALSVVLSLSMTILVGFAFLNLPVGFSAVWGDPTLEIVLIVATAVALVIAALRGAFARVAPAGPTLEPLGGEEGGADLLARAEAIARERRRLRHALRGNAGGLDANRLREQIAALDREARLLGEQRDAEYHG